MTMSELILTDRLMLLNWAILVMRYHLIAFVILFFGLEIVAFLIHWQPFSVYVLEQLDCNCQGIFRTSIDNESICYTDWFISWESSAQMFPCISAYFFHLIKVLYLIISRQFKPTLPLWVISWTRGGPKLFHPNPYVLRFIVPHLRYESNWEHCAHATG